MDLEGAEKIILPVIDDKINYAVIDLYALGVQGEEELNRLIKKIAITHTVEVIEQDVNISISERWQDWLMEKKPVMKVLYAHRTINNNQEKSVVSRALKKNELP
jgi:hypothetical protein